jgi:hypothetical protein
MSAESVRADRAFGAMVFTVFGSLWLEAWVWYAQRNRWWLYVLVGAVGVGLLAAALRMYRRNRPADCAKPESEAERRNRRLFHLINIGQWAVILIGVNVLNDTGLGAWDIAFIILVIGAHFLPLARLFKRPTHYVTGMALVLFALGYPFTPAGPQSAVGPLGAGLILWASALWALIGGLSPASPGSD